MFQLALAKTHIETRLTDYSNLFLIGAAVACLMVFLYVRKGRQKTQRETNKNNKILAENYFSNWLPLSLQPFNTICKAAGEKWELKFSSSKLIIENKSFKTVDGFFEVGQNSKDVDFVIAPLVRKLLLKYREGFEKQRPIVIHRIAHNKPLLSWVQSESHMRRILFQFLDECLEISDSLQLVPKLSVVWDERLCFSVSWPCEEEHVFQAVREHAGKHSELSWEWTGTDVVLSLRLGFTEKLAPHNLPRGELFQLDEKVPKAS